MRVMNFENSIVPAPSQTGPVPQRLARGLVLIVKSAGLVLVAAVPLVVVPTWGDAFNYPKAIVISMLAGMMVVGWAGAYVLTRQPRWIVTIAELPLWAFLFLLLASSWVSVNLRLTILGAPYRYEGLLALFAYCTFFFVGVHFFGSERGFRSLAIVAGGAAIVAICFGISRLFFPPLFQEETILRELYDTEGYRRIISTPGNPVTFGGYLAFMIPLIASLGLAASGRSRLFWLGVASLGLPALFVTFTRAAWLAALVGVGILLVTVGSPVFRQVKKAWIALAVAALLGIGLAMVVITPGQLGTRVSSLVTGGGSVSQRVYIWARVIDLVRLKPSLGWGLETLREVFPYERVGLVKYFGLRPVVIDEAHNDILQMAVSIGVPGATLYFLFWACIVITAVRLWRRASGSARLLAAGWLAAVVAYLIQAQFSFSTVALAPIVWLLAGSVGGWEAETKGE